MTSNQHPEQASRDLIDARLEAAGRTVQDNKAMDLSASLGVAVREFATSVGLADCVLVVDRRPVGVVAAKPDAWGQNVTVVEDRSSGYAAATLKWINDPDPLPFVYEATGTITRFTDGRDPTPCVQRGLQLPQPTVAARLARSPAVAASRPARPPAPRPHRAPRPPDRRHHRA